MDEVKDLIANGEPDKAIALLKTKTLSKSKQEELLAIESRYRRLHRQQRLGILSFEQSNITESQVTAHLMALINTPDDVEFSEDRSITREAAPKAIIWKYITALGIVLGIIVSVIDIVNAFAPTSLPEPKQLTVFVVDERGNAALSHVGRLNIPLGNRTLNEIIGDFGRINFGDITADNVGDSITIGLLADGWEIDGGNRFLYTGDPVKVVVKKDDSLRRIKGSVKTRDGASAIPLAKIEINADTTIVADDNGLFDVLLPSSMSIDSEGERYLLTISKYGFKTVTEYYSPLSSFAQIRLEPN